MKKIMQRTAQVRFTDYREHRIDINLRIYSHGKRWDMDINALGQDRKRIPISITSKYLRELNGMLREEIGKVMHHAALGKTVAKKELKTDLIELAKLGNFVFMEIFDKNEA